MTSPDDALSITIAGAPDFGSEVLKALYRITGRSSDELRRAILSGEPVYAASLFGDDHLRVVPRLEQTVAYLTACGIPFVVHEWAEGEREEIRLDVMHEILESGGDG